MTELVPILKTGELLDVSTATTDVLLDMRGQFGDYETEIRSHRRTLDDELVRRMDYEGKRTFHFDGRKLEVNRPVERVWDLDLLQETLERLVRDEVISQRKAGACLKWEAKPVARELRPLESDPRTQHQIAACFEERPATRYLKVT